VYQTQGAATEETQQTDTGAQGREREKAAETTYPIKLSSAPLVTKAGGVRRAKAAAPLSSGVPPPASTRPPPPPEPLWPDELTHHTYATFSGSGIFY